MLSCSRKASLNLEPEARGRGFGRTTHPRVAQASRGSFRCSSWGAGLGMGPRDLGSGGRCPAAPDLCFSEGSLQLSSFLNENIDPSSGASLHCLAVRLSSGSVPCLGLRLALFLDGKEIAHVSFIHFCIFSICERTVQRHDSRM